MRAAVGVVLLLVSPASAADKILRPVAVAATEKIVYVVDRDLPGVWKIEGGKKTVFFQGSKQFRARMNAPRCAAVDAKGNLYVGDSATREVYRFAADAKPEPLTDGKIGNPVGIAIGKKGEVFVADAETHRIWQIPESGKPVEVAAVRAPRGLAIDGQGNLVTVAVQGKNQLISISPDGKTIRPLLQGRPLKFPGSVTVGSAGRVFVTDSYGKKVYEVAEKKLKAMPFSIGYPVGIYAAGKTLYITDTKSKSVYRTADGKMSEIGK